MTEESASRPPAGSIVAIAAFARNRVIGNGPDIPWRISADWKRFRRVTDGHVLIMGRKTYASIGRPLPGRHTIVITRDAGWQADGVITTGGVSEAIALARTQHPESIIFIAGGGEIYRAAWDSLEFLDVTEVDAEPAGDITFPPIDSAEWRELSRERQDGFAWVFYERVPERDPILRVGPGIGDQDGQSP
ncbi:dihydrofolate reductase [Microlunatus speluncae]|uniref:dihydrofolate reductase n=1 Tax=Microlunatus speluncae TaxID=2594267 RepID=UPI0012667EE8|nr:dihydrofolate reductase [Microlunatus speluncae]